MGVGQAALGDGVGATQERFVGRVAGRLLVGQVLLVVGVADDLHVEEHARVVGAAELSTLALEVAELGGGHLEVVAVVALLARDDVHLHEEAGDPEGVDDVGRGQPELDGLVDREHQGRDLGGGSAFVDHRTAGLGVTVGVVERPRPLLGHDLDHDIGVLVLEHLVLHGDGPVEEHDHGKDGHDGVENLERQVVTGLDGDLVLATTAVGRDAPEDQAPHQHTCDEQCDPRPLPQVSDVDSLFGARGIGGHGPTLGLGLVLGVARAEQKEGETKRQTQAQMLGTLGEFQTHERASLSNCTDRPNSNGRRPGSA